MICISDLLEVLVVPRCSEWLTIILYREIWRQHVCRANHQPQCRLVDAAYEILRGASIIHRCDILHLVAIDFECWRQRDIECIDRAVRKVQAEPPIAAIL